MGAPALAQPSPTTVLVAPFETTHPEAAGLAAMLPDFLGAQLGMRPTVQIVSIDDIGTIADVPAYDYAASCPRGEFVGCAFVLAEAGGAAFAVTGTVTALQNSSRVDRRIVDIVQAREIVAFEVDFGVGDDAIFAEGVGRVLDAALNDAIVLDEDIRREEAVEDNRAAAGRAQIAELEEESGGAVDVGEQKRSIFRREAYTLSDLSRDMNREGAKPWDRVQMTPREYLRYKNADLPLYRWRELAVGRQGQIIVRGYGGFGQAPSYGFYYGRVGRSGQTLQVLETYAWQSVQNGSSAVGGLSLGVGVTPTLEVSVTGGASSGRFETNIDEVTEGDFASAPVPQDTPSRALYVGPQVLWVPRPTSKIRPVIGGFGTLWLASTVENHYDLPDEFPNGGGETDNLESPAAITVGPIGGVEVRVGERVDLWAHVPIGVVVSSWNAPATYEAGGGVLDADSLESPQSPSVITAALHLGVQVRMLGKKPNTRSLDAYE
ncbi:MAG: hypothetical protein AAFV53_19985 [Myxococcota bacterium]